ncbi:Crp/Fnr family transcriptional regulator [Bacteroides caecimuris]|uniref:Crp/Fnr family transcriptional regulator n=1 Tax=Bacteroides caecimuris TaxID=1796613 RepID=UPI00257366C1|nr:cyclic nucleotide-binding domain-containing protein [Bacteroides caecimuris]
MPDLAINNILKTEITLIQKMIQEYGHRQLLKKNQYFCRANSPNSLIAYVVKGGLKYCCYDYKGKEQVLSFAFDGELVGSYLAWQTGNRSLYDIQAIEASELFCINIKELSALLTISDFKISATRFVEVIAFEILRKTVSMRCQSPEQCYLQLLSRVPDILERTTLRNVASYLGITPEALSRMRTRMLKDD